MPFVAPLPMMVLGVVTGTLQAFIFVMLTIIYLAAAVHTDHEHEAHENEARRARGGLAVARRQDCGTSRSTPGRHHPAGVTAAATGRWPGSPGSPRSSAASGARGRHRAARHSTEVCIVKKTFLTMGMVLAAGLLAPAYAQERGGRRGRRRSWRSGRSSPAGFALAFAAAFGALGQGKAVSAAVEGIARNPGAAGDIRGALILGLVLIESLVIYVLLISLILFFVNPFGG